MKSKFGSGKNILIAYLTPDSFRKMAGFDHPDPLIDEFTYGQGGGYSDFVRKNLGIGNYIFFHATIGGLRYITAYYVVSDIKEGYEARHDNEIKRRFKNPHIHPSTEWLGEKYDSDKDTASTSSDIVVFGNPMKSKDIRNNPLPFDRGLAEKLEFEDRKKIRFDIIDKNGRVRTETECINSSTRHPRILTDKDIELLLREIENLGSAVTSIPPRAMVESVAEPSEMSNVSYPLTESGIEEMIYLNPEVLGEGLKVVNRQLRLPNGRRVDLLLEDMDHKLIVTEIKEGTAPDETLTQLQMYVKHVKGIMKGRNVLGAVVCEDCSVALKDAAENSGTRVYFYEMRLGCNRVV